MMRIVRSRRTSFNFGCKIQRMPRLNQLLHAQLFKTLADGGNGLRQVQVALGGASSGLAMRLRIGSVYATTGEHIGAGREAGGYGTAGHQHFNARTITVAIAVAQEQHGGSRAGGRGFALGVQKLVESWHAVNFATKIATHASRLHNLPQRRAANMPNPSDPARYVKSA